MYTGIQLTERGLSGDIMISGSIGKLLQMCLDEIGLGQCPAIFYLFADTQ